MTEYRHDRDQRLLDASTWLTVLTERPGDMEAQARFEAWRNADPRNATMFDRVAAREQLLAHVDDPGLVALASSGALTLPALDDETPAVGRSVLSNLRAAVLTWWSRPVPALAAGLALVLVAVVMGVVLTRDPPVGIYGTTVAEIQDVRLPDGSVVTMGARSRIAVAFQDGQRQVRLLEGEAFFDVAKDRARPFVVEADGARVRVLGTKFGVRRGATGLHVAVEEGTVEVTRRPPLPETDADPAREALSDETLSPQPAKAVLRAGEQIVSRRVGDISPSNVERLSTPPSAWRDGRLIYVDVAFAEVVADINRYHAQPLILASSDLADMRVTGVFLTEKIGEFVDALPQLLAVALEARPDGSILVSPRDG